MGVDVQINELFTSLYTDIKDVEEKALLSGEFSDMTYNDFHVIDAIGPGESRASSDVSKKLNVTMGTLTKAIDGLVNKGYVSRERSETDKRKVMLSLKEKGIAAYRKHEKFHKDMVSSVLSQMSDTDAEVLARTLNRLQIYFNKQLL